MGILVPCYGKRLTIGTTIATIIVTIIDLFQRPVIGRDAFPALAQVLGP